MQDEQVVISQSESRDSGYYQCRTENEAGMVQGTIHVSVVPSSKSFKSYIKKLLYLREKYRFDYGIILPLWHS